MSALHRIARRIASVSPRWRDALRDEPAGQPLSANVRDAVETIREGHLLHHGESRVLRADTSAPMKLLIGDYCYAAGLCDIAEARDVPAVRTLAGLIADVSVMAAGEAGPGSAVTAAERHEKIEQRWQQALSELT